MKEKGQNVVTNADDNSVEFNIMPDTFVNAEG